MNEELLQALIDEVRGLRLEIRGLTGAALSAKEAASYIGVSERSLATITKNGHIKRVRVRVGRYVYRREELDRYLREHEGGVSPEEQDAAWYEGT